MARAARVPFACILNHAPASRDGAEPAIVSEARTVLKRLGAPVLRPYVVQRAALAHSLVAGKAVIEFEPHSPAAAEIAAAWQAIERAIATAEKGKADGQTAEAH